MGRVATREDHYREISRDFDSPDYQPRTPLGERLWRLRQQILKSEEPLLDWDDLDKEVAERRGEKSR